MTRAANAESECPPVAATTEGRSIALRADAVEAVYSKAGGAGKLGLDPRKSPVETRAMPVGGKGGKIVFQAATGQIWAFGGKRGRVLAMLATMRQGVTPWDCWPWHTRLGASVNVLRDAGLSIETVREGPCRHARYFLQTEGRLIKQAENREAKP